MFYSTLNCGARSGPPMALGQSSTPWPPRPRPGHSKGQAIALGALSQGAGAGGTEMLLGTPLISTPEVLHFVPGLLTPQPPPGGMCLHWDFATTWQGVPWTCPLSICWLGQGRHCLVKPPCPGHPLAGGQQLLVVPAYWGQLFGSEGWGC